MIPNGEVSIKIKAFQILDAPLLPLPIKLRSFNKSFRAEVGKRLQRIKLGESLPASLMHLFVLFFSNSFTEA